MTNMDARRALGAMALIAVSFVGLTSVAAQAAERDTTPGSFCPAGYLCGQNWAVGSTWLYSDLGFSDSGLTGRVTSEQFPPPGEPLLTQPISLVSWYGAYIDEGGSPCTKPQSFRIEFYNDDGTGKPDCAHPVVSYSHLVPQIDDTGEVHCFAPFVQCAPVARFTVRLPALLTMPSGHFSIMSDNIDPDCFFLLAGSPEGNDLTWRWYETPTPCYFYGQGSPGVPYPGDIAYCLQPAVMGACCLDCAATCTQSDDFTCAQLGGRFTAGATCAQLDPNCGAALGACCYDDGTCAVTTCQQCEPAPQACCLPNDICLDVTPIECTQRGGQAKGPGTTCWSTGCCAYPYCIGDLNCDGTVGFSDINPFVLYLSNPSVWAQTYICCALNNGDINCDGTYPSFADINPFVALLSTSPIPQCPSVCPAPTPAVWGGPGSTCDPNDASYGCCTVIARSPEENEPQNCVTPDNFNGGCDSTPPVFSVLPGLSTPIYGESGTFDAFRDMDWYSYTSVAPSIFTVAVRAEFPPAIYVMHDDDPTPICVDNWTTDLPASGLPCDDVTLVTHCLPPGKYYFIVAPNTFTGVPCGADYKLTVDAANCEPCAIVCDPPDYPELSPCNDDPNHVDENGGCYMDPNNPQDPNSFETLPLIMFEPYTVCGTTWANEGARDLDWYRFTVTQRFALQWIVESEVPLRASLLFNEVNGVNYPPTCDSFYYYSHSLVTPCTPLDFDGTGIIYQPGAYWFLVYPQQNEDTGLWYGYPCGRGNPYHQYKITFTCVGGCSCGPPCLDPAFDPTFEEDEPTCGPGYVDATDGGCDAGAPYHTKPIAALDLDHDYCGSSGAWLEDPNDPATVQYDYDWYEFMTPAAPANGRWYIYLNALSPMTWEIWPASNCAAGPIEGLEMPCCSFTAVRPAQCYPANTRYWLRVYPTDASAPCGTSHYYLGMYNYGGCSVCSAGCAIPDNDDVCGAPDTNEGCNGNPVDPSHFRTFAVGNTYCGRSFASAGYHDPDWFKINWTAPVNQALRFRIQAAFPAFVGLYPAGTNFANPSCAAYDADDPVGAVNLLTACSGTTPTNLNFPGLAAGVYVGVIYPIDYFGNLLTNYYPCTSTHNDYKIIVTTYVP